MGREFFFRKFPSAGEVVAASISGHHLNSCDWCIKKSSAESRDGLSVSGGLMHPSRVEGGSGLVLCKSEACV